MWHLIVFIICFLITSPCVADEYDRYDVCSVTDITCEGEKYDPDFHGLISEARKSQEADPAQALAQYERAIRKNPGSLFGYIHKVSALKDLKRYQEALSTVELVLQRYPTSVIFHYHKAWIYSLLGERDLNQATLTSALNMVRDRLESDPYNYMLLYFQPLLLADLGRHEEAKAELARLEQLAVDPPQALDSKTHSRIKKNMPRICKHVEHRISMNKRVMQLPKNMRW